MVAPALSQLSRSVCTSGCSARARSSPGPLTPPQKVGRLGLLGAVPPFRVVPGVVSSTCRRELFSAVFTPPPPPPAPSAGERSSRTSRRPDMALSADDAADGLLDAVGDDFVVAIQALLLRHQARARGAGSGPVDSPAAPLMEAPEAVAAHLVPKADNTRAYQGEPLGPAHKRHRGAAATAAVTVPAAEPRTISRAERWQSAQASVSSAAKALGI